MNRLNTALRCLLVTAISLCYGLIQAHADDSGKQLTMMTYNIQGHTIINSRQVDKIASVIKSVTPDVVAIQEVDQRFVKDCAEQLGTKTGMKSRFLITHNTYYGIALLSKEEPLGVKTHLIPKGTGGGTAKPDPDDNRGIIIAEFPDYYFLSTHYSLNAEDRDVATDYIIKFAKSVSKPVFLGGDLNIKETYRAMVTFKNNGFSILNNGKNESAFALTITNSTFVNNYAGNRAGAIYIYSRDVSKPLDGVKIINSTITANYSTKNLGGGIFVCSNTDCSSKLVLVNTIIAGNTGGLVDGAYFVPTDLGFWKGDKKDGVEIVRNYDWELKNCVYGATYATADDTQLNNVDHSALFDNSNIKVTDFATSKLFTSLYKLDNTVFPDIEGDEVWSPALSNDATPIASLCENSIAIAKGTASYAGVTIPTTDQLGTARPATPAIGAVEYGSATGLWNPAAQKSSIKIWNDGNQLFVDGFEGTVSVSVYDLTGKQVYEGTIQKDASTTLNIDKGIYVAKVNNVTAKLVMK